MIFTSGTVAAFYHQDIQPGSRHDQCGNATGNARTDHNGIKFVIRHALCSLPAAFTAGDVVERN